MKPILVRELVPGITVWINVDDIPTEIQISETKYLSTHTATIFHTNSNRPAEVKAGIVDSGLYHFFTIPCSCFADDHAYSNQEAIGYYRTKRAAERAIDGPNALFSTLEKMGITLNNSVIQNPIGSKVIFMAVKSTDEAWDEGLLGCDARFARKANYDHSCLVPTSFQ